MSLNPDAVEERAHRARAGLWRLAGPWWLMLVTGIAWLIISVMVLRFRLSSITTVGVLIGVLFLLAMFNEFLLASVLGLLLIFRGTLDIISSTMVRDVNSTWWLGLVAGILEILLGFWASQQMFPARAALLLLWIGFFALFRGISEIVIAFELRSRQHV